MKISFLGIPIDNLSMQETLNKAESCILQRKPVLHTVVNAAKIVGMKRNPELDKSVRCAGLVNADGQAVVWASRLLGQPLKERVAGIDLMQNLVKMSHEKKFRVFLFGAREEVVKKVAEKYSKEFSPAVIAGYRNGYYHKDEEGAIALQIAESRSDILFVAMTSPKKEIFLFKYSEMLSKIPFIMGVGGSFDVVSGIVKRAPQWMQKNGLEWLYRVYQEPGRMWKRYLVTNSIFIYLVLKDFLFNKPKA